MDHHPKDPVYRPPPNENIFDGLRTDFIDVVKSRDGYDS